MIGSCRFLGTLLVVFMTVVASADNRSAAILRLLNSRAAGSPKDFSEAAQIVAEDAEKGMPLQQFVLAVVSSETSPFAALRLSKEKREKYLAASKGRILALAEKKSNALAWYLLSLEKNDLIMLKRAADGGNIQAMNAWGTILLTQTLSDHNLTKEARDVKLEGSFGYFSRAAAQKDANGLYNLGMCYMRGYGCEKNERKAFDCFRTSAEAGHPEAINNLGGFCRDGLVVAKDLVLAAKWFAKSAKMGNAYGQFNYALALQRGEGVAKDEARAAILLLDAAKQGSAEAMNAYGMCLMTGDGVEKNEAEAALWYRRSAGCGFAPAMENLAACYDRGLGGLPKSAQEATVWKVRARAARGDRHAAAWLKQNGHAVR